MTARLIATLGLVVAGVATLAHSSPGDLASAAIGWGLIVGGFVMLASVLPEDAP